MSSMIDKRGILPFLSLVVIVAGLIFSEASYANADQPDSSYHINSDITSVMNKAAINVSNEFSDEGMGIHEAKEKAGTKMTNSLTPESILADGGAEHARESIAAYKRALIRDYEFKQRYQQAFHQELRSVISNKEFWTKFNAAQAANSKAAAALRDIQMKSLNVSLKIVDLADDNRHHVHVLNEKFVFDDPKASEKYTTYSQQVIDFTQQENEILAKIQSDDKAFKESLHPSAPAEE